jgi:hypothetical protein
VSKQIIRGAWKLSSGRNEMEDSWTESLSESIESGMVLSEHPELQFVPNGILDKLVCEDAVIRVLEKHQSRLTTDVSTLARFVCDRAKRLFATLVFAEVEHLIDHFYEHDFEDKKLPVSLKVERTIWRVEASRLNDNNRIIDAHPFNDRNSWTRRKIADFQNSYQWPFLCPVFVKSQFEYEFHERFRMPFVDKESRSYKESMFSIVEEWRIHRNHIEIEESMVRLTRFHPTTAFSNEPCLKLTLTKTRTCHLISRITLMLRLNH